MRTITVTEYDMHHEIFDEMERRGIFEAHPDITKIHSYLEGWGTPPPTVGNRYVYASIFAFPGMVNVAHFKQVHELVRIENGYSYFNINNQTRRFPEHGPVDGGSLVKHIFAFPSVKRYEQMITDVLMKFNGDEFHFTFKELD